jgi:uncharacterized membrane protein YesL
MEESPTIDANPALVQVLLWASFIVSAMAAWICFTKLGRTLFGITFAAGALRCVYGSWQLARRQRHLDSDEPSAAADPHERSS